jgi:hypothetical protein
MYITTNKLYLWEDNTEIDVLEITYDVGWIDLA